MSVGQRLKEARKEAKMSGEALGSLIGVTKGQISNIEKGTSQLTKSNAIVLSDKLNINVNWLLTGEEPKEKSIVQISGKAITFKESNVASNKVRPDSVTFNNTQNDETTFGRIREPKPEDYTSVPFIPVTARASFLDRFPDMDYQEMGTFPVYNLDPELKRKGAVVIEVNGDSMETQLPHQAKVLGVPVDAGDWNYMTGVHAIVYANRFTIKRIISNTLSREGGEVVLKADNGGAEVAVPGSELYRAWKIIRIVDSEIV